MRFFGMVFFVGGILGHFGAACLAGRCQRKGSHKVSAKAQPPKQQSTIGTRQHPVMSDAAGDPSDFLGVENNTVQASLGYALVLGLMPAGRATTLKDGSHALLFYILAIRDATVSKSEHLNQSQRVFSKGAPCHSTCTWHVLRCH